MPDANDLTLRPPSPPPDEMLAVRRDELALLVAAYQREQPRQGLYMLPAIGGLGTGVLLMELAARLRLPELLQPVSFALGWVVFLGAAAVMWRRDRRRLARYRFDCPECAAPLIQSGARGDGVSRAQLAIATGCCPECDARILG